MATFKAMVHSHYTREDRTYLIRIRVTHKRRSRYIKTGLVAISDDLTRKFRIKNQAFIDATDKIIKGYRQRCNEHYQLVEQMDIGQLVSFLLSDNRTDDLDFLEFARNHIAKLAAGDHKGMAGIYTTAINSLKRFIGRDVFSVAEINVKFLKAFEQWIRLNPIRPDPKAVLSMSRAPSLYLSSIRALHNEMKLQYNDEDAGVIRIPWSPFAKYRIPQPPMTQKRAVSPEIIRKIMALPDEQVKNSSGTSRYNIAKDCFLLSFCLMGINSADLYHCSEVKNGQINYKRKKTRYRRADQAVMCVYIPRQIMQLVSAYMAKTGIYAFTFSQHYANESNFNKAINKGLKKVGKEIGVPDLTYYSARHSWATIALNKCGVDKYTVHAALNHVDPEMKVTDIYLEKDWDMINAANQKVMDYVFKTESQVDENLANGKTRNMKK